MRYILLLAMLFANSYVCSTFGLTTGQTTGIFVVEICLWGAAYKIGDD